MNVKNRYWIRLLLVILLSFGVGYSQSRRPPKRPAAARKSAPFLQQAKFYEETPAVTKVVLKNGMTVLVNEHAAHPIVSIQAYVRAGLLHEPSKAAGLARLAAAMVFRGTSDKSVGTFRQKVQALGGTAKSLTDYEHTEFEITTPSAQWKKALELLLDALLNPSFERDTLELEINLIRSEALGALDNPSLLAGEKLFELGFNRPGMGKNAMIALSPMNALTRENLIDFYQATYSPARVMLVISGDIRSSEALNEVVRIYTKPAGPVKSQASLLFESAQNDFRYRAMQGDIPIPRLLFGFHAVSQDNADYRAVEVLAAILGIGQGSVLNTRLRDQKKLIFSEETKLEDYPGSSYLSIQMLVDPENIDRSEIAALTEIELLKREEPDEFDMERALAQLELLYWKRLETVSGRARTLANFEAMGDWKRMDRYLSELRKVKPSDVRRVAEKYLRLQNCSLLEYLPAAGEPRAITAEDVRRTFEGLLEPSVEQEKAERAKDVILAVKIPAAAGKFTASEIRYSFQPASILRGPDIFIREDHTAPVVDLGVFFPGGKFAENKENAGITELLARLIIKGTQEGRVTQFYRQIETYGGRLQPVVRDDYFGFYFSVLSRNFESGFGLLRDAIKTPDFDKEEIARQREIQVAEVKCLRNSDSYPWQRMNQALFKDFSYGLENSGTEKSLAEITPDALTRWYDNFVKNRKPVVAAIGDTKGSSLANAFVQSFSGSRMQDTQIPDEFVKPLDREESIVQSWNKNQSMILIGFQAPPVDDEDVYASTVFQSYAGDPGLLSQELRDGLGLANEVSVIYEPRLRGGAMIVSASTIPGREDAVSTALREAMQRMTDSPMPYRDFRSALNSAVGINGIRNQSRFALIADLIETVLAGKGIEGYQSFSSSLQRVREDDLREIIRRILRMDRAVILRVQGQSQR